MELPRHAGGVTTESIGGAGGVRRWRPRDPAVRSVVNAVWSTGVAATAVSSRILPDAHIDIVWDGEWLRVAGPDTTARVEALPPGRAVIGLQLASGAALGVLGVPASAVRDDRVDLADLWGTGLVEPLVDTLHAATDVRQAAASIESAIAVRTSSAAPVDALAGEVRRRVGRGVPVAALDDLGIGERQLRRRCITAFGYGPKVLARILRFQAFLDRLHTQPEVPLAIAAADAGYADQAHLNHDVVALTGLTPGRLRASLTSDPYTTRAA